MDRVDGHNISDDDVDSYEAAYESADQLLDTTDQQLLDTLTEYQQKLEKTNFIDETTADEVLTPDDRGPVPLPRHRVMSENRPQSGNPTLEPPDSPSDSIDVSELEEDEYLDC